MTEWYLDSEGTLKHHGILGQKWGERNGPPYPLDASQASPGEKSKGFKESKWTGGTPAKEQKSQGKETIKDNIVNKVINKVGNQKAGLSSESAAVLIELGLSVVLTIGLGLVNNALTNNSMKKQLNNNAQNNNPMKKQLNNNAQNKNFKEIPKTKPEDIKEACSKVNPRFKSGDVEYAMNCTMCTTAYELRRRGYDVTAEGISTGVKSELVKQWFDIKDEDVHRPKKYDDFVNEIESMPTGSRGNIMTNVGTYGSLHSMAWEKTNNGVIIIDAQENTIYNSIESSIINSNSSYGYEFFRTDNATINEEAILQAVKYKKG